MSTECSAESFLFEGLGGREAVAAFDGGRVSSDAGVLILREVDALLGVTKRFAACFTDHRDQDLIGIGMVLVLARHVVHGRGGVRAQSAGVSDREPVPSLRGLDQPQRANAGHAHHDRGDRLCLSRPS